MLQSLTIIASIASIVGVILAIIFWLVPYTKRNKKPNNNKYYNTLHKCKNIEDLLKVSINLITEVSKTDYNQVFLLYSNSHSTHLICVASNISFGKQNYRICSFNGIIGEAFSKGLIVNIPNVEIYDGYYNAVMETKSELALPIKGDTSVIGVINSESENIDHYQKDIENELEKISNALGKLLPLYGYEMTRSDIIPEVNRVLERH